MRRALFKRRKKRKGFTLLEVMIAITIMVIAFGAILTSESGSITMTMKTKELTIAGELAHRAMVEAEQALEGKPFNELDKVKSEAFPAPFGKYKWKREVSELKFPSLALPQKEGQGVPETLRIMTQVITKYLNDSIREMTVTVTWPRGNQEEKVVLSTYLIDLNSEFNFSI